MKKGKYIVLEIIPSSVDPKNGDVIQLSALKIDDLKLIDRFDYRLDKDKVNNIDLLNMTNYDNDNFIYLSSTRRIMMRFKKWIENYDLLIIDNIYTKNYLKNIKNNKESIFNYLNMQMSDDVIEKMMDKYNLEPSNHIVDLLYEALISESNNIHR
ncbi:MAG: hypothetical protein J6J17_02085 [Bacilli bacterium]|nr:hypothetical protein [Bacilli bacterium]